jgi:hypothetical protein
VSKKKKTTSKNTPWAPAQPYITDSLSGLQSANQQAQSQVANTLPVLNSALARVSDLATNKPAYMTDAQTQLDRTINGDFLGKNPYASGLADIIADKTGAQYNSTFGAAGRSHGGLAALLSGQGIGDALGQFYGNQYSTDRGLQQQAIMAAPGFYQNEFADIAPTLALANAGVNLPLAPATAYASGVTGATSPYVQNTTTQKSGGLGQILGGALQLGTAALTGGASLGLGGLLGGAGAALAPSVLGMSGLNAIGAPNLSGLLAPTGSFGL